jgi:hypothetical protein
MTLSQIILASVAFGFGSYVAQQLCDTLKAFLAGVIFSYTNRTAAMLRLHSFHCPKCALTCGYMCPGCGQYFGGDTSISDGKVGHGG